jgi:mono/diheme cytochrome c family protein
MLKMTTGTILSIAGFVLVLGAARPASAAGQDDAVKKGEQVYAAQKCATCHSVAGKGSKRAPLDGVGKKLSADEIKAWIVTPKEMTAKTKSTKKPVMTDKYSKLPAADIDALVAYMQSLK